MIIGQEMDKEGIDLELEICLCTVKEILVIETGARFKDSFPQFD
ncbi:MAG: hypothetical protein ABJC98_21595 [Bacteroidota bacterium]